MPGPAVAAGPGIAAILGTIFGGTGSLADWLGLANQAKAQEGLKYNAHVFAIEMPVEKGKTTQKPAASMATPAKDKGSSSAGPSTPKKDLQMPNEEPYVRPILRIFSDKAEISFAIYFYLLKGSENTVVVGSVNLSEFKGFDTAFGNQAEIQFEGASLNGYHLLSIMGMVNPWVVKGKFVRFSGEIIIKYDSGRVQDIKIFPLNGRRSNADGKVSPLKIGTGEFLLDF